MNLIARQTIKNSILKYFGLLIGAASSLFIYPLDWALYGQIQFWLATATILTPILRLGSTTLINKFYSHFKSTGLKGFLGFIIGVTLVTIIGTSLLVITASFVVLSLFPDADILPYFQEIHIIYPLAILIIFSSIFRFQSANMGRIVIPDLIEMVKQKFSFPILILLALTFPLSSSFIGWLIVSIYAAALLADILYIKILGGLDLRGFKWGSLTKGLRKEMLGFWMFGGLNFLGTLLAYKLDNIMIGSMLSYEMVAFYSTFLFLSSVIDIPFQSINKISAPIVSNAFREKDYKRILSIYQKSTANLSLAGVFIFCGIWINLDALLELMTNGGDLRPYQYTFLILGLGRVFDLTTGVNNLIIVYSPWYKTNLLFLLVMSIMNVLLNYFLIAEYGIIGAALATFSSIVIFNIIKTIYVWFKLKMQPFTRSNAYILLLLAVFTSLPFFMDIDIHPIAQVAIQSVVYGTLFLMIALKLNLSNELTEGVNTLIRKIKR